VTVLHLVFDAERLCDCIGLVDSGDAVVLMDTAAVSDGAAGVSLLNAVPNDVTFAVMKNPLADDRIDPKSLPPGSKTLSESGLVELVIQHPLSQTW
jgi:hypothetical protein